MISATWTLDYPLGLRVAMARASALLAAAGFAPHHRVRFVLRRSEAARFVDRQGVTLMLPSAGHAAAPPLSASNPGHPTDQPRTEDGASAAASVITLDRTMRWKTEIQQAFGNTTINLIDIEANTEEVDCSTFALAELNTVRRKILNRNATTTEHGPVIDVDDGRQPIGYSIAPEVDVDGKARLSIVLRTLRGGQRQPWTAQGRPRIAAALSHALSVGVSLSYGRLFRPQVASRLGAAMHVGSNLNADYTTTMIVQRDPNVVPHPAASAYLQPNGRFVVIPGHGLVDPRGGRHSTVFFPHDLRSDVAARVEDDHLIVYDPNHGATNDLDCALARVVAIDASLLIGSNTSKRIIASKPVEPSDLKRQVLIGRHNGRLIGCRITNVGVTATVAGPVGSQHLYNGMFTVEALHGDAAPTYPGDSGAPILIEYDDGFVICGMVIAGSDRKLGGVRPQALALPIDRVLNYYGMMPASAAP